MYYVFDVNGKCVCSCNYEPDEVDLASRNEIAVENEEKYELDGVRLVDGRIVTVEPDLVELMVSRIDGFKKLRDLEEYFPIEWNGNLYDYDAESRERMRIKRQDIEDKGGTGKILWTLADNGQAEIGLDDFKGINSVAAERSEVLRDKYNSLKAKVEAVTSEEELENIVW